MLKFCRFDFIEQKIKTPKTICSMKSNLQIYNINSLAMQLAEIKEFLSVQASFVAHCKHVNSFNLYNKVGKIDETNPFDYDRC